MAGSAGVPNGHIVQENVYLSILAILRNIHRSILRIRNFTFSRSEKTFSCKREYLNVPTEEKIGW